MTRDTDILAEIEPIDPQARPVRILRYNERAPPEDPAPAPPLPEPVAAVVGFPVAPGVRWHR